MESPERSAEVPKSNVFCAGDRQLLADSTYQMNYDTGKLNMSAYAQTQKAADEGRVAASLPVTKVNIFPGHQTEILSSTTYGLAFNKDEDSEMKNTTIPIDASKGHNHLKPSCKHCMYEAILDSHHFKERSRTKQVSDTDQNESLRGTHFTFGNDKVDHVTAYKDFTTSTSSLNTRRTKMVSPPTDAEVLPRMFEARSAQPQRSSLQTDFTYFGSTNTEDNHRKHTKNYNAIQTLHGFDSVGESIQGRRGRLMSRSMLDYVHPLSMRRNENTPKIHRRLPVREPIQARRDNTWSACGRREMCGSTENRQNFSWLPSIAGTEFQRFCKGQLFAKVR